MQIYSLIIKVNKLFSNSSVSEKKQKTYSTRYIEILVKVGEILKMLWKHLPLACVPTNFHLFV